MSRVKLVCLVIMVLALIGGPLTPWPWRLVPVLVFTGAGMVMRHGLPRVPELISDTVRESRRRPRP